VAGFEMIGGWICPNLPTPRLIRRLTMGMHGAPKDRSIILFQDNAATVLGRWHGQLGWIAEYKDIGGEPMVATVRPVGWMRA
jgi:hypothetical protein